MQTVIATAVNPLMPAPADILTFALLSLLPAVVIYVWTALALSRVFTKIGVEGWKAWVPIYNAVVFLGLGGLSGWLLLLYLIPVFGVIFVYVAMITAAHRIGVAFGYGAGMTVLAALLFPVWASILGFGNAEPRADRDAYARAGRDDTGDGFRALSPDFGRQGYGDQSFSARRDVPAPSAWIPPAPVAEAPYEVPAPTAGTAPRVDTLAPAIDPAPVASSPGESPWGQGSPPPAAPASVPAPPSWEAPGEREPAPAEPAPVTSWWMPAAEPDPAPEPTPPAQYAPAEREPEPERESAPEPARSHADPVAPAPQPVREEQPVGSDWQRIFEPAVEPEPAVAPAPAPAADREPEQAPAPEHVTPRAALREAYVPEPDAFPEDSGEVSAVVGSPTAGAPRTAASSVSAFRPGMSDFVDDTVIASRKRPAWSLQLPDGTALELTGDTVVLGRRPVPVHSAPGAQLITVVEETRTVSKTHALLRRQSEGWLISDLGSTNGVVVDEVEVEPGETAAVEGDFLLGDAVLRLVRRER